MIRHGRCWLKLHVSRGRVHKGTEIFDFFGSILDQLTLTFIRNLVDSVFNFNLDHFISPPVSLDCIEFCIM